MIFHPVTLSPNHLVIFEDEETYMKPPSYLHLLEHEDMEPPIALLVYRPDKPEAAGSYPFTEFSPEFQALRYGMEQKIITRFFDLPQATILASPARPMMTVDGRR